MAKYLGNTLGDLLEESRDFIGNLQSLSLSCKFILSKVMLFMFVFFSEHSKLLAQGRNGLSPELCFTWNKGSENFKLLDNKHFTPSFFFNLVVPFKRKLA